MSVLDATSERIMDLGAELNECRRLTDLGASPYPCFPKFVRLMKELDPSDFPERVRLTLRVMGQEEEWDNYLDTEGIILPDTLRNWGGPVRWVIAPII